ncbi:hypothetical protein [Krasilnikovia sp. MM14-A1259]|uniref:hypothetical protein n=1 Tax=Krasilnikovia sp. MM14-A1259 TaxID=3373539 RepID=UPI00381D203E
MQRGKTLIRAVTAVLLTGAVGLASPAPASAVTDGGPPGPFNHSCFGYVGTFKGGSSIRSADWNKDGRTDECFGIAPGRTIWHAWPNSGGWKQMPNNGRADEVVTSFKNSRGQHEVTVRVFDADGHEYCSTLTSSWQPWVHCIA